MHSAAGTFDLALDRAAGITCAITVELRIIGVGHRIVFQFDAPKTSSGLASLIDVANAPIGSVKTQVIGNDVVLTLTNVADNRRVKVGLTGVNGSLNASVSIGFLAGDVNNSFSVNASDITAIKARSGQTVGVSANNFRYDINVSGSINASDIITVKERSGVALGTSPSPAV